MTNTYLELNAQANLLTLDGFLQVELDKQAARAYFLEHVNQNTVFFHSLEEKIKYMIGNGYWANHFTEYYTIGEIKEVFKLAYSYKHRFSSFVGAYKFYTSYACKTYDGSRYLERFEDRVSIVALTLAEGDATRAKEFVDVMMTGTYQPATPTFLNAGRGDSGEMVSCFLLRVEDNMESISRSITNSLQLSKRGGGVALLLSNIREEGAPIKKVEGQSSGVIPIMKLLEDAFSYANQLGARQGAGAVYLNACHPDIMKFLDTKRENADEKVRIKSLSLGVVIPDVVMHKAAAGEDVYLFSPYDIERNYGMAFADISITKYYDTFVEDSRIRKSKISARKLLQTIAEIQFESGYPYVMFEDTVNRADNVTKGWINMSNLCSEILQPNTKSFFNEDGSYAMPGDDISCNLGSLNIAKAMNYGLENAVRRGVLALTAVSEQSDLECVPSIAQGNETNRSIGLGQMNLHGFLANNGIIYGSDEALDFVNVYFSTVRYWALRQSMELARKFTPYVDFPNSKYAVGTALTEYCENPPAPKTEKVKELFKGQFVPSAEDWEDLSFMIQGNGLYHSHLLAVPPTGSISYVNGSTPSIHPVTAPVEIRKEGKMGRVYYPAPGLNDDNLALYQDAYTVGYEAIIDTYAVATKHTDQGLSLTLFMPDTATTRDINKAQIYAWKKGIKTIYYLRVRQSALEGTEVDTCVSCTL